MNGTHRHGGPGGPGRRAGFGPGPAAEAMWQAMDQFRAGFDGRMGGRMGHRMGGRMGRGDVRASVLALLAEQPMHGYQIIKEIEERTAGSWKPSAGSVYPTLQLLADEGLVTTESSNDRKIYALTEAGREEAASSAGAPWESDAAGDTPVFAALPKAGFDLAQAAAQVARSGTSAQQAEAVEILDKARRALYAILAQD